MSVTDNRSTLVFGSTVWTTGAFLNWFMYMGARGPEYSDAQRLQLPASAFPIGYSSKQLVLAWTWSLNGTATRIKSGIHLLSEGSALVQLAHLPCQFSFRVRSVQWTGGHRPVSFCRGHVACYLCGTALYAPAPKDKTTSQLRPSTIARVLQASSWHLIR